MASPGLIFMLLATLNSLIVSRAGPLGPLPNVTSVDMGFKEGSCALGDVVYLPGDVLPGSGPCERCTCTAGGVQCDKERCEPRPGCKALHRPDHCCPTYQCECEQEGRVYGNGEKLVDPADPCRVCYCQGGEVVCRRIACFLRDDCTPRLVPGRCCPEYDNCPIRGVTSLPSISTSVSSVTDEIKTSVLPIAVKENIKQEITIKEITPVSEIPIITDVKVKEILPSPSIDVAEYSSSKSPLIPREATSEKITKFEDFKTEAPTVIEVHSSLPVQVAPETIKINNTPVIKDSEATKISFSTEYSINSDMNPSNVPIVVTMGSGIINPEPTHVASTSKTPAIDDEELSSFDMINPAFPPIPDDLSVLRNHEDEIVPELSPDSEHIQHEVVSTVTVSPSTQVETKQPITTTTKDFPDTTVTTENIRLESETSTVNSQKLTTISSHVKESSILRSAIPTEVLNKNTFGTDEITSDINTESSDITSFTEDFRNIEENTEYPETVAQEILVSVSTTREPKLENSSVKSFETKTDITPKVTFESTTSSVVKSHVATEVTSQTELSSLPIETSDQKPHESINNAKDKLITSTVSPITATSKPSSSLATIPIKYSETENIETTEFVSSTTVSTESATEVVETFKISGESTKSAAIINSDSKKNNVFKELVSLVSDVASISDTTEVTVTSPQSFDSISESEELLPVNAGYKSKNSNWNVNSITEMPPKSKTQILNKQKVVEIEDDDSDNITDSPSLNEKVEPTTRRPIIDNVSDDKPANKTEKKDIEIISQSYVPTINKRPTKVIMKKNENLGKVFTTTETATEKLFSTEIDTTLVPTIAERIEDMTKNSSALLE